MADANGNGNGRSWASHLALASALAAVLVPMGMGVVDLRADLERVEKSAADARTTMREDLREDISTTAGRLEAAIGNHNSWAEQRNGEIGETVADLRERVRKVESELVGVNTQVEIQHRWIRDALRWLREFLDMRTRAFWDGGKIVWPDLFEEILDGVGEARVNGNGHK